MYKTVLSFVVLLLGMVLMLGMGMAQEKAVPKDLVQYIRDARKAGLKDPQIQKNAEKAGWPAAAVSEAIAIPPEEPKPAGGTPPPASFEVAPGRPANPAVKPGEPATWAPDNNPASPSTLTPPGSVTKTANPETGHIKPASGVSEDYRIGEGDVLQIAVFGEPSISVPSVVVRTDGKISMPLIKEITVAGMRPTEVEKIITEQLSKMLREPDVTVIVAGSNSHKIFMVGAVKKEGPLFYGYRMTVMQAISEAGGLTDFAKRKKIYVIRNENGRQFQFLFDYDAVMKGQRMEMNRTLEPGDTVVVPH
jgi:polysaccharide export outer membrane protein